MAVIIVMRPGWELQLESHVARFMDWLADEIATDARRFAPVDTSELRNSILVHRIGPTSRRIHAHAPYAAYVELGTRPHIIRPNVKKALYWTGAPHPVKVVHHPGTHAQPYLRPAAYMWRSA